MSRDRHTIRAERARCPLFCHAARSSATVHDVSTIPGVDVYHPRESWEDPNCTIASGRPPAQLPYQITTGVVHYSAATDPPDDDAGIAQWLRNIQRDYLVNRGYSIGYLFCVDQRGGVWELRGFTYKAAANSPTNDWTAPVLFNTGIGEPATPEQWRSTRAIFREFARRSGNSAAFRNRPYGHGQLPDAATACPGAPLLDQLDAGLGDLNYPEQENTTVNVTKLALLAQPARMLDTRQLERVGSDRPSDDGRRTLKVPNAPAGTKGVEVTVTAVDPAVHGYFTIWAQGARPIASCLNTTPGHAVANTTTTALASSGTFELFVKGDSHVVIDVLGYWS